MPKSVFLSCVVDDLPRLHVELVLWAICVRKFLPRYYRPVVYFVGRQPGDLGDWVRAQGIETRDTEPLIAGSPHCNKIIPFFDSSSETIVAVSDVDLYFVADPSDLFCSNRFCAPPNNHCVPPPYIWKQLLAAAGFGNSYRPGIALFPAGDGLRETYFNNINGGLVTAPSTLASILARFWEKWAVWLIENRALMQRWAVHVDQVGFSLALEEMGEDVAFLPPQTNTILHLLDAVETVYGFHLSTGHIPQFSSLFNPDRTLIFDDFRPGVAAALELLNSCIREAVEVIECLPSTRDHFYKFLNPAWSR